MSNQWRPNVTVAAVVENEGRFLFVEERHKERLVINQPAGHLEDNETLIEAVVREVYEETQHRFEPQFLIGVYRLRMPAEAITYLRFCFSGISAGLDSRRPRDSEIERVLWLSRADLESYNNLRSALVTQCIDDYLEGRRFPLSLCADAARRGT